MNINKRYGNPLWISIDNIIKQSTKDIAEIEIELMVYGPVRDSMDIAFADSLIRNSYEKYEL